MLRKIFIVLFLIYGTLLWTEFFNEYAVHYKEQYILHESNPKPFYFNKEYEEKMLGLNYISTQKILDYYTNSENQFFEAVSFFKNKEKLEKKEQKLYVKSPFLRGINVVISSFYNPIFWIYLILIWAISSELYKSIVKYIVYLKDTFLNNK